MPQSESDIRPRKDGINSILIRKFTVLAERPRYNNVESITKVDNAFQTNIIGTGTVIV